MSAEISFTKRAAAELSRCFNGITVRQNRHKSTSNESQTTSGSTSKDLQKPLINETTQLISSKISGKQMVNNYNKSNNNGNIVMNSVMSGGLNTPNCTPRRGSRNGQPPPQAPPKTWRARRKNYFLSLKKPKSMEELWIDTRFLINFFTYFTSLDRCVLAQVSNHFYSIRFYEIYSIQSHYF